MITLINFIRSILLVILTVFDKLFFIKSAYMQVVLEQFRWELTEYGLKVKKVCLEFYEYRGKLMKGTNCLNSAFLVHPLELLDATLLGLDEKTLVTFKKYIQMELRPERVTSKGTVIKKKKKFGFVYDLYKSLGNRIIGAYKMQNHGKTSYGILMLNPYLPEQMKYALELAKQNDLKLLSEIANSIIRCFIEAKIAGAQFVGLGAFNSIIAQCCAIVKTLKSLNEYTFVQHLNMSSGFCSDFCSSYAINEFYKNYKYKIKYIERMRDVLLDDLGILPCTSGNDLTAVGVAKGVEISCKNNNLKTYEQTISIIGGTGSVGAAASQIIAKTIHFNKIILCARDNTKLVKLRNEIQKISITKTIEISTDVIETIKSSDIVVFAASATAKDMGIENVEIFNDVKIICDASQPQTLSRDMIDLLDKSIVYLTGAIFKVPGKILGYQFLRMGMPNWAYGCLSATILRSFLGVAKSCGNGIKIIAEDACQLLKQALYFGIIPVEIKRDNKINLD